MGGDNSPIEFPKLCYVSGAYIDQIDPVRASVGPVFHGVVWGREQAKVTHGCVVKTLSGRKSPVRDGIHPNEGQVRGERRSQGNVLRRFGLALLIVSLSGLPLAQADDSDPWNDMIAERVRDGMLLNHSGRYDAADEVWAELRRDFPDHPAGTIYAMETLYSRQVYDLFDSRFDEEIESTGREALQLARAWQEAQPESARAHLFVGQAEMQLGRFRAGSRKFYAAGRHAERAGDHLERAVELDPELVDGRYWFGMYHYAASELPNVLHWLDWLWFIPEGDANRGLDALREASSEGDIERYSANLLLMNIFTYFERDHGEATRLARSLHDRFPNNSFVHFELVRLLLSQRQYDATIMEAKRLESHPAQHRVDRGRVGMARVWQARALRAAGDIDAAAEVLDRIDPDDDALPLWGRGWAQLLKGQVALASGRPEKALAELEGVVAMEGISRSVRRRAGREIDRIRND